MLKCGKVYKVKTGTSLNLYSKPYRENLMETNTVIFDKRLENENFVFLEKTKDTDFLDENKKAYWYKILLEGKIFYLWLNENNTFCKFNSVE